MARNINSFTTRFPYAGLFLVIAIALAVPLTVWSLNHVPTQTQQQAATYTCQTYGGSCFKDSCPSDRYSIAGNCKATAEKCCKPLPTPTP